MENRVTLVITCKDREKNLGYCLHSLANNSVKPNVIVVDFGSKRSLVHLNCLSDNIKVVRTDHQTEMFHKSRAINIGLKNVRTEFTCSTDCDEIFAENFVYILNKELRTKNVLVMCKTYAAEGYPENESYVSFLEKVKNKKVYGIGNCLALPTQWLLEVNGWNEKFIGWGEEDTNLFLRARYAGFKIVNVNKQTSMIHLPHPKTSKYYSEEMIRKNKKLSQSQRPEITGQVVVNRDIEWGKNA